MKENEQVGQPRKKNAFQRFRELPGSRIAAAAFAVTVVLGLGVPAAWALWSQQGTAVMAVTAGKPVPTVPAPQPTPVPTQPSVPPGTIVNQADPVFAARPGKPAPGTCTAATGTQLTDTTFTWTGSGPVTHYVISVTSTNPAYAYAQSQTVPAAAATFRFDRSAVDQYGKPVSNPTPYYTDYRVRVMPMNGSVAGDPLYWTYKYEHYNVTNCYWADPHAAAAPNAAPLGKINPLACTLPELVRGRDGYAELVLNWAASSGASSYDVTIKSANGRYGAQATQPGVQARFRTSLAQPGGSTQHFSQYSVRVQPMNGTPAGDPVYLTYQLGANSHECWATGNELRG